MPDDDIDEDYQEVNTSAEVSKKRHHVQYIAPQSMNRVAANLVKKNRVTAPNASQKNMHAGPKSFARIREEMKNDDPNQELPTLTQMFKRTRKRTEGHAYVDTYDDTASKIEQMKNYKPTEDGSPTVDPFLLVMNKENYGYCRLYGKGVTNALIKKVDGVCTSYMISEGLMDSLKANSEAEKNKLLQMRKEFEEDCERKRTYFEGLQRNMDKQQHNLEAMIHKVMKYLPIRDGDE